MPGAWAPGDLKIQTTERTSRTTPRLVGGGVPVLGVVLIGTGLFARR